MRRVLIVSPHFPPDTAAASHRVRLIAPHLPANGWDPTVVTVDPRDVESRLDPGLARLVPESLRVIRVRAWPAGLTRRIGVGDLGLRSYCALGTACTRLLATERFDALFITIYPTYPALLGPNLKRQFGVPFILDYQDPWVGAWGRDVGGGRGGTADVRSRATRWIAERLEPATLRAADGVTAVSARTFEDALARVPGARPRGCEVLPIGWDSADMAHVDPGVARRFFEPDDGLIHCCSVGTVLPLGTATIEALLDAVVRLRVADPACGRRLRLHFIGTSNQTTGTLAPRVLPLAAARGLSDVVFEHPPRVDYLEALGILRASTIVLVPGSTEPHYTASRLFPAILSGRPVLAAVHEASSVAAIMRRIGAAPRLVTFGAGGSGLVAAAFDEAWHHTLTTPAFAPDLDAIRDCEASRLAARLARLFETVAIVPEMSIA